MPVFDGIDRLKIVFVDGVFDPEASDDLALEGVQIDRIADICGKDIHWAKDLFGVLEARGQDPGCAVRWPRSTPPLPSTGWPSHVTGKPSKPISLVYVHESETSDALLHHVIRVEPGAEATFLENGPAAARFNKVIEADVADGGTLHHVRGQGRDHERRAVTHMFTRLGTGLGLQILHADRERGSHPERAGGGADRQRRGDPCRRRLRRRRGFPP